MSEEDEKKIADATTWAHENKCTWTDADKTLRHENGRYVRASTFVEAVDAMRTHHEEPYNPVGTE